jgi:hypothetical protein
MLPVPSLPFDHADDDGSSSDSDIEQPATTAADDGGTSAQREATDAAAVLWGNVCHAKFVGEQVDTDRAGYMAWGTPLPDSNVTRTVDRVLKLTAATSILNCVVLVVNLASASSRGTVIAALLLGMVSLLIPFCGWHGAKQHNAGCLCMFCAANWGCLLWSILLCTYLAIFSFNCYSSAWTAGTCSGVNRYMLAFECCVTLCMLCASAAGGFYGNKLYTSPNFTGEAYQDELDHMAARPLPALGVRLERLSERDAEEASAARAEWAARPQAPMEAHPRINAG